MFHDANKKRVSTYTDCIVNWLLRSRLVALSIILKTDPLLSSDWSEDLSNPTPSIFPDHSMKSSVLLVSLGLLPKNEHHARIRASESRRSLKLEYSFKTASKSARVVRTVAFIR